MIVSSYRRRSDGRVELSGRDREGLLWEGMQ
jgi:hypothetical protein